MTSRPLGRPYVALGAIAGVAAAAVVGVPLALVGAMEDTPARVVGSTSPLAGWTVFLLAGATAGAVHAALARTRFPALAAETPLRGATLGAATGAAWALLVGWLGASLVIGRAPPLDGMAAVELLAWASWGGLVGGGLAWVVDAYRTGRVPGPHL